MPLISVTDAGTSIGVSGDGYFLKRNGHVFARLPSGIIDQFVVGPEVEITRKALAKMSDTGIPVAFIDYFGRLKTRLAPIWKHNAIPRISQALAWEDSTLHLQLAKRFVAAKLANSAHVLNSYAKNYTDPILKIARDQLLNFGESLKNAKAIPDVRA